MGIFIAKLYIFSAAINSGLLWLAVVGVINSVVSAYYYLRIVRVMYLEPALLKSGCLRLMRSEQPWVCQLWEYW